MNKFRICISTPQKRSEGDESYSSTEDDISRVLRGTVKNQRREFFSSSSDSKPDSFERRDIGFDNPSDKGKRSNMEKRRWGTK